MTKLTDLTISGALNGLENKDFTAQELTQSYIDAMAKHKDLNAYITETPEIALKQAGKSDKRRAAGDARALDGIPLAIKDLFCTDGVQTTAASRILDGFIPQYESTVTKKLFDDGVVMLGKANLDEFAMGSSNTTSHYGNVISPWKRENDNQDLTAGGSSGGSAAAVAARICMGATGTDTGGSIRQPASFCGISGVKPTYGRCSRWGTIAFASSLDQAGSLARTVKDNALLLQSMAGYDAKDSTSANRAVPDFAAALTGDIKGKIIGIPKEYRVDNMPEKIAKLWEQGIKWLEEAGAKTIEVSLPHTKYALATYYVIAPAEASSNLARYDGVKFGYRADQNDLTNMYELTRAQGFGEEVKRRIMIGTYALSSGYYDAYYIKAQKVRRLISQDFMNVFEKCDALLTPTAPSSAFAIGENEDDPIKMYLNDIFTVPASLAGLPAMSVPAGIDAHGLPLGLQVIARPWDEETVFKISDVMENMSGFNAIPKIIQKGN